MSIASRLWLSAAVILAVLTTATVLVLWVMGETNHVTEERGDARETLIQTEDAMSILLNAETGQRGYLITGLDRYLAPYQNALRTLPDAIQKLKATTSASPTLQARVARLEVLSQAKLDELKQSIEVRRDQGFEAAEKIVATDRGKTLMDGARTMAGEIEAIEQATIDRGDAELRRINAWLFAGLIFGNLAVAATIVTTNALILRSLGRPLKGLGQGIARIAMGDLAHDIEVRGRDELNQLAKAFNSMMADLRTARSDRQKAEAEVARVDAELKVGGLELERRSHTIDLLGRMANRMPGCTDEAEFIEVIRSYLPQIFPGLPGALYTLSNSQNLLRRIVGWNDPVGSDAEFTPLECWGLRRGQPHVIANVATDIVCAHVHPEQLTGYRCVPLVAQGETVGLLYLEGRSGQVAVDEQYLQVLTETVASSLVNLRLRERLRNQSVRDPLTGLFNRRYLEESLELECARAERSKQPLSVAMVDIDHFKKFNDSFGHDAGDVVLKNVGEMFKRLLRQGDVACRYGGEEFCLVFPGTPAPEALIVAERIRLGVQQLEIAHRGHPLGKITVSIGMATTSAAGETPAAIVDAADEAMYKAKKAGRDRIELHQAEPPSPAEAATLKAT